MGDKKLLFFRFTHNLTLYNFSARNTNLALNKKDIYFQETGKTYSCRDIEKPKKVVLCSKRTKKRE